MIVLIPITVQNWETAASLELEDDQQDFIRSNAWSIAESLYHPELKPFGIYRGGTMVGFLMYGKSYRSERTWLYRLMIDKTAPGGVDQQVSVGAVAKGLELGRGVFLLPLFEKIQAFLEICLVRDLVI